MKLPEPRLAAMNGSIQPSVARRFLRRRGWALAALILTAGVLEAELTPEQARAALHAADESREPFPRNVLSAVFGFDRDHLARLDRGEAVTGEALFDGKREVAVVGAVRLRGDRETFVRTLEPDWRYRHSFDGVQRGVFSDPPQLADLAGLRLAESTLDELRRCRPGDCDVQLSATGMERFHGGVDWNAADASEQAQRRFRHFLLEYLREYIAHGFAGTEPYEDRKRPIDRVAEFEGVLGHAVVQAHEEPVLHAYLRAYPRAPREGIRDTFYWILEEETAWSQPTLMLMHGVMWTDPDDPTRVSFADKLLYASHYAVAGLGEMSIIEDKTSPESFYVVRSQRTRFHVGGGLAHGVIMNRVHDGALNWLETELDLARRVAAQR